MFGKTVYCYICLKIRKLKTNIKSQEKKMNQTFKFTIKSNVKNI